MDMRSCLLSHRLTSRVVQPESLLRDVLPQREFAILELFLRNVNRVLSRDEIAQHIWAFDFSAMSNVIDVYIGNLRRKLNDNTEPRMLRTVRGAGYLLHDPRRV